MGKVLQKKLALMDKVLQKKLVLMDDGFPCLKSGFRVSEYNYYLEKFPDCELYSEKYASYIHEYAEVYPKYREKIKPVAMFDINSKNYALIYTVFLNNLMNYFKWIKAIQAPFVFTLYPGGGFWLNDPGVDDKLTKVFKSPLFKKVIVTQKRTYDYIVDNHFAEPDKVEMIYGMVTHPQYFNKIPQKKYYKKDKAFFDICFVAHKYMQQGIDKGYDVFIKVCHKLAADIEDIRFHVVGNYDEKDMDVTGIRDKIKFYGLQDMAFFLDFYSGMDLIISPNVSFVLIEGKSFDGFPVGCCIDAALNGVGLMCTDDLKQNRDFVHRKDIVIIPRNVETIVEQARYYYTSPEKLYALSALGQLKSKKLFDFKMQMEKRAAIIETAMQ